MNLWLLKHDTSPFSKEFFDQAQTYVQTIPQLKKIKLEEFSNGNLHFVSFSSADIPKKYNQIKEGTLKGYSGLLVDKSTACNDVRNIENVVINPENYYGQFALYQLDKNFECFGDVLGFHKVFYGKIGKQVYISNSFELLKKLDTFEVNTIQMLKDYSSVRFGIFPGYNTLLKNIYTLPEYGKVALSQDGKLILSTYKDLTELLLPKGDFEAKLKEAVDDYKSITRYLSKYHHSAIGLSGGFDGRLILNLFHTTQGKNVETFTYNRAGNLDLYIASVLSQKAKVAHEKFKLSYSEKSRKIQIEKFKDSSGDAFYMTYINNVTPFFKLEREFKVVLNGNGGDTDWEFGEKRIADVDKSSLKTFIYDYSVKLANHPILKEEIQKKIAKDFENYLWNKYSCFSTKENALQLLASAFFHLERFRPEQGFLYTQNSNKYHDVFAPFAIESFNQLVFLSTKNQLQRGLKQGIHYRLSYELTNGKIPFAPILTSASANEHGENLFQNLVNKIAPYLPKVIWKLNNGDTNTQIRNQYKSKVNSVYKDYILENTDSPIFDFLDKNTILSEVEREAYNGSYNAIGGMIKTLQENHNV